MTCVHDPSVTRFGPPRPQPVRRSARTGYERGLAGADLNGEASSHVLSEQSTLLSSRRRLAQVLLRLRLVLERRDLVGIDANHQVVDVVLDLREPVARTCRNDDDITGL